MTCGEGVRKRVRLCDDPPPANGGKGCAGKSEEFIVCKKPPCLTTPLPPGATMPSTTPADDCHYAVQPEDLTDDNTIKKFNSAQVEITDSGIILFTFDEPRTVTSVSVTLPRTARVILKSGPDQVSSVDVEPDEKGQPRYQPIIPAATEITSVEITSQEEPIEPEDIGYTEVDACEEFTTPLIPQTTTTAFEARTSSAPASTTSVSYDCVHTVTPKNLPATFEDGSARLDRNGRLVFVFSEPKRITRISIQTADQDEELSAVPKDEKNEKIGEAIPLVTDASESTSTDVDVSGVFKLIIRRLAGNEPLQADDFVRVDVIACVMPTGTTPRPRPTTTAGRNQTTAETQEPTTTPFVIGTVTMPISEGTTAMIPTPKTTSAPSKTTTRMTGKDCEYEVKSLELVSANKKPFSDGLVTLDGRGELIFEFDEPKELTAIRVKAETNPFVMIIPIVEDKALRGIRAVARNDELVETKLDEPVTAEKFKVVGVPKRFGGDETVEIVIVGCGEEEATPTPTPTPTESTTEEPEDCEYLPWQTWGTCSKTCDLGKRSRVRGTISASNGGVACDPVLTQEEEDCSPEPCVKDCVLSSWTGWSDCSVTCGQGITRRTRQVGFCLQLKNFHAIK